ncbi:hypothetical protein PRZ48_002610 [Zasmidium cellare]|uniref:SHSP domain-containing protein n=1 Tax=Zasmidium cellare TaxID=395010 RepID=A0ABR0ESP6_ZASCE|nr:hypothetical protein PRZ48_002610 [Zasmidium cellare]
MPSVRYYNASAPFWDFVADMENQATNARNNNEGSDGENEHPNPWAGAWGGAPWGAFPFRDRRRGHRHHHGPPPPHAAAEGETDPEEGPSSARDPPPPFTEKAEEGGPEHHRGPHGHGHGPHRRCGPGARGGWGGRGRGGFWGGPRGRGHFHPYGMGPFGPLADMFQTQLFGDDTTNNNTTKEAKDETFTPEVDVFDTPESFVVHISLPGAKKEDVGVNWDADKSELSIGGVVYRPGDEEFLKTLALDERKIGAFERKVRLGSRANPAQVDVEGISARMEDGVLRVEVPKLDGEYVEVKKVDIE